MLFAKDHEIVEGFLLDTLHVERVSRSGLAPLALDGRVNRPVEFQPGNDG